MFDFCLWQVDYVEPSQNTISLKMIPRIDLDRIKARMSMVGISTLSYCVCLLYEQNIKYWRHDPLLIIGL